MRVRNHFRMMIFGIGVSIGASAMAHDTPPPGWCATGQQGNVVTFSVPEQTLATFKGTIERQATDAMTCPSAILGMSVPPLQNQTCGIVDDWHYAHQYALRYCADLAPNAPAAQRPLPFFTAPATFDSTIQNHHGAYAFSHGNLNGTCRACVSTSIRR